MTKKHKTDGPNDLGYGMLYAREADSINRKLSKEDAKAVSYNILQYIAGVHGYGAAPQEKMSDKAELLYSEIVERIERNIKNGITRPYGAPKGNQNARAKDYKARMIAVAKLLDDGLSERQIADELDIAPSSAHNLIVEVKGGETAQNNISDEGAQNNIRDEGAQNNIRETAQNNININKNRIVVLSSTEDVAGTARKTSTADNGEQSDSDSQPVASRSESCVAEAVSEDTLADIDVWELKRWS